MPELLKTKIGNASDLPEGYRMTELGVLPNEWRVVRLGEVFEEVVERVRDSTSPNASSFPILSLTKTQGLILQSNRFKKRIATEDISSYKVVRKGQIVYNPYVIWEGAIHILHKYTVGLVSPVYPVLEVKNNIANPFFLDAWLRTPLAIEAYNRFAAGAVNRRRAIRKNDFWSIQFPLPPLPEQRAIAYVLRAVQEAKEATERVIAAARELKKSLMRHLFTYGPVPIEEKNRVRLQETEIGPIPAHWRVVRLEQLWELDVLWVKNGFPKGAFNEEGLGAPHLRPFNIDAFGKISLDQVKYVPPPPENSPYWLKTGDIVFNNTNSEELVGKVAYFDREGRFVLSNHMTILRVKNSDVLNSAFLASWLLYLWTQGYTQSLARRHVNQASISLARLKSIPVPLPSLPEQREIARVLQAVDKKIKAEENRKEALEALFKSLLRDLMTARRRLPREFVARFAEEGSKEVS